MSAAHVRSLPWGCRDSFRERSLLTLVARPKGKNRKLKIDRPIELIVREGEMGRERQRVPATPLVW